MKRKEQVAESKTPDPQVVLASAITRLTEVMEERSTKSWWFYWCQLLKKNFCCWTDKQKYWPPYNSSATRPSLRAASVMQPYDAVERDKVLNAWSFRLSHQTSLQLQRAQPHWPRSYRAGLWSQREPHQQPPRQDLITDWNPSNVACIYLLINHDGLGCQLLRRRSRESLTEQQVPTKPSTQGSTSTYLQYFIKALTSTFLDASDFDQYTLQNATKNCRQNIHGF